MCVSSAAGGTASFVMGRKASKEMKKAAERRLKISKQVASNIMETSSHDRLASGRQGQVAVGDVLTYFASSGFDVGGGNAARAADQTLDVYEDEQSTIDRNARLDAWLTIVSGEAQYEEGMARANQVRRQGNIALGTGVASSVTSAMTFIGGGGFGSGG